MGRAAKIWIFGVIGIGGLVAGGALTHLAPASPRAWAIYIALAVLASLVKLRLPASGGTYSGSFLFLLYGIAHFSFAETLIAGVAGVLAQCLLNVKKRPT